MQIELEGCYAILINFENCQFLFLILKRMKRSGMRAGRMRLWRVQVVAVGIVPVHIQRTMDVQLRYVRLGNLIKIHCEMISQRC